MKEQNKQTKKNLIYLLFSLVEKLRSPPQRSLTVTISCCVYSGIQREVNPCWNSTSTDAEPVRPDVLELHLEPEANCGALASAAQEGYGRPGVTFDPELERGGSAEETSDMRVDVVGGMRAGAAVMVDVTTLSVEANGRLLLVLHYVSLFPPCAVG